MKVARSLQLRDVTRGLTYIHGQGVIHGDLKGVGVQPPPPLTSYADVRGFKANILINQDGHACLADLSLVTIISDQKTFLSSHVEGGAARWMSPELLDPDMFGLERSRPTKEADCYALGMVIYEVLSGQAPFASSRGPVVIRKVLGGERPERPRGSGGMLFTDSIWRVMECCWEPQPGDRMSAKAVLLELGENPTPLRPSSDVDGGAGTDSEDQSDAIASDPGMFSPFRPRLISNHPHVMAGPPTVHSDNILQTTHSRSPSGANPIPAAQQDGGRLPASPLPTPSRMGTPKRGRVGRLTRKISKCVIKMLYGR